VSTESPAYNPSEPGGFQTGLPTYPPTLAHQPTHETTHPPTQLPTYLWHYSPCRHWPLFQFLNLDTVGRTPGTGDQPVAGPLLAHRTKQSQNTRTQTSMLPVGLEPTIPVFERAKTVHAWSCAATVIVFQMGLRRPIMKYFPCKEHRTNTSHLFYDTCFRGMEKNMTE
jgi:hypothetical protein